MTTSPGTNPSGSSFGRRLADEELTSGGGVRPGFGGAVAWTVAGTLIPGLGLWRAGRRVLGGVIMGVLVLVIGGLATLAIINPTLITSLAVDPNVLYGFAAVLAILAVAWITLIATTHLALRPRPATVVQRLIGGGLVGVLAFAVAAPLAFGANFVYTSAGAVNSIFDSGDSSGTSTNAADPWAGKDRINVLILGGDSGVKSHRSKAVGARTDTVIVASIDTHTGAATLITLPRNTENMPFPPDSPLRKYYPNGFTSGSSDLYTRSQYLLNAMYRDVPAQVPNDILGKTKDFGAAVLMQSVGYALGLEIDNYIFVNMDGFKDFVNAIGGITVNVNYRIPVGGHQASGGSPAELPSDWIEVGANQHLTGGYALWYARGRYSLNDYSRMERQRCVINAVVKQADPANVLLNYQAIVKSGESNISTNISRNMLPALGDLALKTKNTKLRSLVFDPSNGFHSYAPNWTKVRKQVQEALNTTAANAQITASPSASSSAAPSTSTSASASPSSSATTSSKDKSDDLDDACAYNPHKYTGK
jgi:polyisoprenyl-teichoic acid--peptidoglycan teichoic acid transferase